MQMKVFHQRKMLIMVIDESTLLLPHQEMEESGLSTLPTRTYQANVLN